MTAISYHDSVNDLQGLDWIAGGPFARLSWFRLLEGSGLSPVIAMARKCDGAIALPLQRGPSALEPLTNWYAFTWQMLRSGNATGLLPALARDLAGQTSRIDLAKLTTDDAKAIATAFRSAGWITFQEPCDVNHILSVAGRNYAEFLAARPGQVRTTLARKAKKVDVTISTNFDSDAWSDYEAIYAESWKPEEGDPALLRAFAEQESAAGRYRFAIACHSGAPIAAQFWTVDNGTAYIHKLAHRRNCDTLSPGTTLTAALFEHVINIDKVQMVDFGTGDDAYKSNWMEQTRIRYRLTCLRPEALRNWPLIARNTARKLVSGARHG